MLEIWGASDSRNSSVKRCGFVLENLSVGLSKTNPTCPYDLTREKHFSKFSSLPLLWTISKNFLQKFGTKFNGGLAEAALYCSRKFKGRKKISPEKFFPSVSDFEIMFFGLLVKKFGRLTKTTLYVSTEDFRRKKNFKLKSFFSNSLWLWADDFQDFSEKCRKCHQSCFLPVQTNILPKKGLEKKNSTLSYFQGKNLRILAWECLEEIPEGTNFA